MSTGKENTSVSYRVMKGAKPFICGGCSACFASFCVQPIDLIKTRIQVVGKAQNIGAVTIAKNLIKNEGVMKLYAGLSASLMRQAIYGTARLGLHRVFSNYLKERNNGTLTFWMSTTSSLTSGALAGIIGNPFDLSMVRMQADGLLPVEQRRGYSNCFTALYRITKEEGLMTLWRGSLPMIMRAMAMNFGMLASYDLSRQFIVKHNGEGMVTNLLASAVSGFCYPSDEHASRSGDQRDALQEPARLLREGAEERGLVRVLERFLHLLLPLCSACDDYPARQRGH
ncbi:uncharacterized protein [Blastocystis hominis]|uniref:Mitochondrial 2-oxoglutarate/malate carrier protein n=1 Tax=Blastocystis hominis TaxID=12968 RepID=D8M2I1_BLAHO|nr:uncharacterized protein [Blastocystis hominis]CBK22270.2 unnamed protein product [Blastocystis hominis]|eukprot:XP_012896318.1 uncharacterized protein [Blastocystis hominis]